MNSCVSKIKYSNFSNSVKRCFRYIHSEDVSKFLNLLLNTSEEREFQLNKNHILYRSQRGDYEEEVPDEEGTIIDYTILPHSKDRMTPDPLKVKNGRVNCNGIPCLYLSDDIDTALAEARPWLNERITLATFIVQRDLKIIDCSELKKMTLEEILGDPQDIEEIVKIIWKEINIAFSEPVNIDDQDRDYVPTQIIGEWFKSKGYDGIKYKSMLGSGNNFALFDRDVAIPEKGQIYEALKIDYTFKLFGNPLYYK